jgi:branched-chain amino acid transport system permease protein
MSYAVHLLTIANIYVVLAISLDLLVGYTGLISLAHATFFGIGAYASAILTRTGVDPLLAIAAGMLLASLLSMLIALPSTRVRGTYLLIITIAVQIVSTVVFLNWGELTGGPGGLSKIPPLQFFGSPIQGPAFLALTIAVSGAVFLICWQLMRSPFGRLLQAIRDDELGCLMLGKNVTWAKITVFAFAGALAALAGSLYAHYTAYVDPTGFDVMVSTSILLMVMLGGAGTLYGPVVGAIVLTLLPELLRFIPAPPGLAAASRQLIYGLLLVLVVFFRPQGLLGRRSPHAHD